MLTSFFQHVGYMSVAAHVEFISAWMELRFCASPVGKLLSQLLEKMKKAHRTRADGWSAWSIAIELMRCVLFAHSSASQMSPPSATSLGHLPQSPPSATSLSHLSQSPPSATSLSHLPQPPPSATSLTRCCTLCRSRSFGHLFSVFAGFDFEAGLNRLTADVQKFSEHTGITCFTDMPNMLRSLTKRFAMTACLPSWVIDAMVHYPKCFFGNLAALVYSLCRYRRGYLTHEERDVLTTDFVASCACGVGGMHLLRQCSFPNLLLQVELGVDGHGQPVCVRLACSSEPQDYVASHPRPDSLVAALVSMRCGEVPGVDASAQCAMTLFLPPSPPPSASLLTLPWPLPLLTLQWQGSSPPHPPSASSPPHPPLVSSPPHPPLASFPPHPPSSKTVCTGDGLLMAS